MAGVKAGCVIMTEFTMPGTSVFGSYIDYIDRKEAVRNDNLEKFNLYNDYMGNPVKTEGIFTEKKDLLSKEEKKSLKSIFQKAQDNGSLMWQTVISFDNRWLSQQGVYDAKTKTLDDKKLKEVARNGIREMLKKENLENATWSAAIHYNTDNIHVHVATVELFPQRKTKIYNGKREYVGRFKMSSIEACKSKIVNGLIQEKDLNLMINKVIREEILKQKAKHPLVQDQELAQAIFQLYNDLPDCPRNLWQYGNNILKDVRPEIDRVTDLYLRKYHMEDMKELDVLLKKQAKAYRTSYGNTGKDFRITKYNDLYRRMGNAILKELKSLDADMEQQPDQIERLIAEYELKTNRDIDISMPVPLLYFELEPDALDIVDDLDHNIENRFSNPHEASVYMDWKNGYETARNIIYDQNNKIIKENMGKRVELMHQEYKRGNVLAAYDLGDYYQYGKGCKIDAEKSYYYYQEALKGFQHLRNHSYPKFEPGQLYGESGKEKRTMSYLDYRIGKQYNRGLGTEVDQEEAYKYFLNAAENGNGYAQYSLASMYKYGNGVEQNYEEAILWYEISNNTLKNRALPYSSYELAKLYHKGLGTEIDEEKAGRLYKQALSGFEEMYDRTPDDKAAYRIGMMYFQGLGTEKNIELAKQYLEESAEAGNVYANYGLAKLYKEMGVEYEGQMLEHLKIVADNDTFDFAQYALGKIYLERDAEHYNQEKGIYYLEKAAQKENEWALYALGKYYIDEAESELLDIKKGLGYLEKAAEKGNEWAAYTLGKIYADKTSSEYDINKSIEYFTQAAEKGNEWSLYRLGKMYTDPELEIYDMQKGLYYLDQAAQQDNDYAKYMLGVIYLKEGEYLDAEKGISYLESIKEKNEVIEYKIASAYLNEELSIYDPNKGITYMMELAEQGNQFAELKIGIEYMKGRYLPKDINQAKIYLGKSAEHGNEIAEEMLNNIKNYKYYKTSFQRFYRTDVLSNFEKMIKEIKRSLKSEYEIQKNIYEYEEITKLYKNQELE